MYYCRMEKGVLGKGGGCIELKTERFTVEDIRGCRRGRCTVEWKRGVLGGWGGCRIEDREVSSRGHKGM